MPVYYNLYNRPGQLICNFHKNWSKLPPSSDLRSSSLGVPKVTVCSATPFAFKEGRALNIIFVFWFSLQLGKDISGRGGGEVFHVINYIRKAPLAGD